MGAKFLGFDLENPEEMRKELNAIGEGASLAVPINLWFTTFGKALRARKRMLGMTDLPPVKRYLREIHQTTAVAKVVILKECRCCLLCKLELVLEKLPGQTTPVCSHRANMKIVKFAEWHSERYEKMPIRDSSNLFTASPIRTI